MTFILQTPNQQELYLMELENGQDAKKAVPKCIMHGKAILLGSANEKYSFNKGYRTLWIFEYRSTMESVLEKLSGLEFFENLKEYFLFKPLEEIREDFFQGWTWLVKKEKCIIEYIS